MLRVLGVLVILLAIAGIVAFSQGWITFSSDKGKVTITGDSDKFKEGVGKLEDAGKKAVQSITPKKAE